MSAGLTETAVDVTVSPSEGQRLTWLRRPLPMRNPVRGYDWGSRTRLAELQGRPASPTPEAELWMGAHQGDPSTVVLDEHEGGEVSLRDLVHTYPAQVLGETTLARFGVRLPFLLKVLGVERALSIQVHPGPDAAEAGYLAEEAAGVDLSSSQRRYLDRHAKPEFLYALTPFAAMAGFRPAAQAARLVASFGLDLLAPVLAALHGHGTDGLVADDVHPELAALATLVHWPGQRRAELATAVAARADELVAAGDDVDDELRPLLPWIVKLASEHPADPLVMAPLLLQLHQLPRGGTIYLPAGVPHAYLLGTGVEIMGASDNVLRAGLTTKHVAADDLLATLDPTAQPRIGAPEHGAEARRRSWSFPVDEFALTHQVVAPDDGGVELEPSEQPQIVLCVRGPVRVDGGGASLELSGGESAFLPAGCGAVTVSGDGEVFRASPGPV